MERYQLAKLVEWAGTLRTRKAMQKIVYLLQSAGCPLEAGYILHHYGPYSADFARLTDEMARSELLREEQAGNAAGKQFNYRLPDKTRQQIEAYEGTEQGQAAAGVLAPFETRAKELANADVRELEYAATVAYFRRLKHPWPEAIERTCAFKRVAADSPAMARAVALARRVVADEP